MKLFSRHALWAALLSSFFLQGCSSLLPKSEFVAADPESLEEWSVEGEITVKGESGKQKSFFEYRQIDGEYVLALKPESPVGEAQAIISGYEGEPDTELNLATPEAAELAGAVQAALPMDKLGFWLRALPYGGDAQIEMDDEQVSELKEADWDIEYDRYMQVGQYMLPDRVDMRHDKTRVKMEMVRAETGFLQSPCAFEFDVEAESKQSAVTIDNHKAIQHLVPYTGAPLPRWIDDQDFCQQLYKVHGSIPDPRDGLFGPDSMMWKLNGPLTPAGMGAGRALLLQVAHPWVTASIDEHSVVRADPLERGRRTFIYVQTLVYGSMPQVMSAANTVHKIHNAIEGELPYEAGAFKKHSEYRANEVSAMVWVSATLWDTLVRMYEEIEAPLTQVEKDRFYEEIKLFNMVFGIPPEAMPANWNAFQDYVETMWMSPQLTVTDAAKQLKTDLFDNQSWVLALPLWVQEIATSANLPPSVRDQYGMEYNLWERMNYGWILPAAKVYNWVLPKGMGYNPVYHEAQARMKGERVGWYQQQLIELVGVERLAN